MRPLKATLSKSALLHNVAVLKSHAPESQLCAIVKANAYGHRTHLIVPIIENHVDYFAVSAIEEAQAIRHISQTCPVILLEGVFEAYEYHLCDEFNFTPTISNQFQLQSLLDAHLMYPIDVFIKINSGMNRLGISTNELSHYQRMLSESHNVKSIQLMTHLSGSDSIDPDVTIQQVSLMATLDNNCPVSISNSAHIFDPLKPKQSIVRAGIALYGSTPFEHKSAERLNLQPVLELKSKVIHINALKKGDKVGYNGLFTAPHDMTIGVVACGYADGYPREISSDAYVLIDGYKAPLVGRVAMDMFMVDLSNVPESKWQRDVIIFGPSLPIELIAKWANTISYTIFTHLAQRIHFSIID